MHPDPTPQPERPQPKITPTLARALRTIVSAGKLEAHWRGDLNTVTARRLERMGLARLAGGSDSGLTLTAYPTPAGIELSKHLPDEGPILKVATPPRLLTTPEKELAFWSPRRHHPRRLAIVAAYADARATYLGRQRVVQLAALIQAQGPLEALKANPRECLLIVAIHRQLIEVPA